MNNQLTQLMRRSGIFDEHTIYAFLYELEDGQRSGWNITITNALGAIRHYWFENGNFHNVGIHYLMPPTGANFIDIGGIADVQKLEKEAMLDAIERWTREYSEILLKEP